MTYSALKVRVPVNKKAVFMWKAGGGGWVYAGKLDTAAARNTSARQMSQVCIFTQDNNKSILKGKWLQLRSWAELRLPFLLRTICAEPYPMWGFSPQKVLQEHVLIHILVNPRLWGRGCAVISTQKRTVTSLWIKAKAERGSLYDMFEHEQRPRWARWHGAGEVLAWRN